MSLFMEEFRADMNDLAKKTKDPSLAMETGYPICLPTSFLPFDYKNGLEVSYQHTSGECLYKYDAIGINGGSLIMFIGKNGSGKTAIAIQMATSIAQRFANSAVIHYDLEKGTNKMRIAMLSGWNSTMIENKYFLTRNINTIEMIKRSVIMHCKSKLMAVANKTEGAKYFTGILDIYGRPVYEIVPTFVILDSIPMLYRGNEEGESSNMEGARTAKEISDFFKTVLPWCEKANVCFYAINHLNQKISTGFIPTQAQNNYLAQDESIYGGNTPLYLSDNIIKVVTSTKYTQEKNPFGGFTGWLSKLKLIKSRTNCAGLEAELIYDQQFGYNRLLSLFNMVKNAGLVRGAGQGMYLEGLPTVKFTQKKFLSKLEDNINMKYCFKELIQHVGRTQLSGNTENRRELTEDENIELVDNFVADLMMESFDLH